MRLLFIDTGNEFGGGTKSFLYLLDGLLKKSNYEIYVFFENDYNVSDKKISQIITDMGANFVNFKPKPKITKIKKEIFRLLSKDLLERVNYKIDFGYAFELLQGLNLDAVYLNNHFSSNLAYNSAANKLNIKVFQHLRKNAQISSFKLNVLQNINFTPICVSGSTFDFYNQQLKIEKNIVYNPVIANGNKDKKFALNDVDFDNINLIMPANFLALKGHDLVFDAFLKLKRDDIKLFLAGSGDFKPDVNNKFTTLVKDKKVFYLGFVDNMSSIYENFDYVLGFSSDEGLPRVVIESLSCGLGVIFSDINVIREIYEISENKYKFFLLSRDSLSLLNFLENLEKPIDKNIDKKIVQTFDLDIYVDSIKNIIDKEF